MNKKLLLTLIALSTNQLFCAEAPIFTTRFLEDHTQISDEELEAHKNIALNASIFKGIGASSAIKLSDEFIARFEKGSPKIFLIEICNKKGAIIGGLFGSEQGKTCIIEDLYVAPFSEDKKSAQVSLILALSKHFSSNTLIILSHNDWSEQNLIYEVCGFTRTDSAKSNPGAIAYRKN